MLSDGCEGQGGGSTIPITRGSPVGVEVGVETAGVGWSRSAPAIRDSILREAMCRVLPSGFRPSRGELNGYMVRAIRDEYLRIVRGEEKAQSH
jgi:hypothetical protein